ncbi:UNVERIFIED_CONTAM: hypothetical protein GTU68_003360, partial [Idotea baltica]|nr:hypothetical protein [Idotea baltica]
MKRALVTGAGRRLGAAIAERIGKSKAQVAVHYHRSKDGAELTKSKIEAAGGTAFLVQADLSDESALAPLVSSVLERMGGLDILVPSAANYETVGFDDLD